MANITEHNTKQEREGDNGKYSWIYFLMHRDAICVHNFLENKCKIVCFYIGWWLDRMIFESFNLCGRESTKFIFQFIFSYTWAPEITDISGVSLSHEIDARINGLFFSDEPFIDFQSAWIILVIVTDIVRVGVLNLINLYQVVEEELS